MVSFLIIHFTVMSMRYGRASRFFLIMDEKKCGTGGQIIINSAERGTMELCIDEKHPAFDLFPTENYTTPQWWKGMTVYRKNGCTIA